MLHLWDFNLPTSAYFGQNKLSEAKLDKDLLDAFDRKVEHYVLKVIKNVECHVLDLVQHIICKIRIQKLTFDCKRP